MHRARRIVYCLKQLWHKNKSTLHTIMSLYWAFTKSMTNFHRFLHNIIPTCFLCTHMHVVCAIMCHKTGIFTTLVYVCVIITACVWLIVSIMCTWKDPIGMCVADAIQTHTQTSHDLCYMNSYLIRHFSLNCWCKEQTPLHLTNAINSNKERERGCLNFW